MLYDHMRKQSVCGDHWLISGDSKPLPIIVSAFLKNPANGKTDMQS